MLEVDWSTNAATNAWRNKTEGGVMVIRFSSSNGKRSQGKGSNHKANSAL